MIEFPFIDFETENLGKILKPFVFVELSNNGIILSEYPMLIDSGADVTLIPKKIGKRLELRIPEDDEIKHLGSIGGGIPIVYRTIELRIEDVRLSCCIAWAQIEDVPSVLGRVDVFDKFDIEFKQTERKIIFKTTR